MLFEKKRAQQMKAVLEETIEETQNQISRLNEAMEKNQKGVRKLSDTMEDFLDTLQEEKDGLRQAEEQENKLLGLIGMYQEQMDLIEQWITGQTQGSSETALEAWKQQYQMLKGKLVTEAKFCTIESIGAIGEPADYRLYEVLQVLETDRKEQEGTIAEVYSHGILYKGKVIKKARAAAYKYK